MNAMRFWPWWVRISNKRTSLFFCLFTRLQERFLSRLPNSVSKKTNRSCHYGDMKNRICFRDINKGARCFLQRVCYLGFSFLFLLVGFYWNVATKHDSQLPSCQIGTSSSYSVVSMVSHVPIHDMHWKSITPVVDTMAPRPMSYRIKRPTSLQFYDSMGQNAIVFLLNSVFSTLEHHHDFIYCVITWYNFHGWYFCFNRQPKVFALRETEVDCRLRLTIW